MGQVRPSNYEIMRDRMEMEFIKYDQAKMIQKFSLQHDADFLYIRFAGREYRIGRKNVRVEWYSDVKAVQAHITAIQKAMSPRHRKTQTQSAVLCDIRGEQ